MNTPDLWGPPYWKTLHWYMAADSGVPCEARLALYLLIRLVLPCISCVKHWDAHNKALGELADVLNELDERNCALYLESRLVDAHNQVNMSNGKPVVSIALARQMVRNRSVDENLTNLFAVLYYSASALGAVPHIKQADVRRLFDLLLSNVPHQALRVQPHLPLEGESFFEQLARLFPHKAHYVHPMITNKATNQHRNVIYY